jgi:DNA-3-methyladenine glycosylase I
VRNRLKVKHRQQCRAVLDVQREFGSLDKFIWAFVDGTPMVNRRRRAGSVPARGRIGRVFQGAQAKGFRFVGTTICYAFMQATGMVNDHLSRASATPCNDLTQRIPLSSLRKRTALLRTGPAVQAELQ